MGKIEIHKPSGESVPGNEVGIVGVQVGEGYQFSRTERVDN